MFALACETVSRRVSRLPFLRSGVMVTGELLGVAMECLNAEVKKSLALTTPRNAAEGLEEGLDRYLEQRLKVPGKTVVMVIADVLCSAGIAEPVEIMERHYSSPRKGIRLLSQWTWHIVSPVTHPVMLSGSDNDGKSSPPSWMSMCPVCRTGILNRVVGKQLFGIPYTDFYNECTHCGAKFIPVGPAYRLVSIATIKDPLWKKHLDKTYPAETWSALARGTGLYGIQKTPGKKPASPGPKQPSYGLTRLKDGSLAVPFEGKTLYFRPVKLTFSGRVKEDAFTRAQKSLAEVLENPAYSHLHEQVNLKYSRYLPLKVGIFLGQLKERHDPFYREFLNFYGDEKYGTFRLLETNEGEKCGVLVVVINNSIYHAVSCPESFRGIINDTYGRILPEDCYLRGDPVRCRINALVCNNRNEVRLYIHKCDKEEDCSRISKTLNANYQG
jgi:hypothetical protein